MDSKVRIAWAGAVMQEMEKYPHILYQLCPGRGNASPILVIGQKGLYQNVFFDPDELTGMFKSGVPNLQKYIAYVCKDRILGLEDDVLEMVEGRE